MEIENTLQVNSVGYLMDIEFPFIDENVLKLEPGTAYKTF